MSPVVLGKEVPFLLTEAAEKHWCWCSQRVRPTVAARGFGTGMIDSENGCAEARPLRVIGRRLGFAHARDGFGGADQRQPQPELQRYLESVVFTINEILDIDSHRVAVYNSEADCFDYNWHFLAGLSRRTGEQVLPGRQALLKGIMLGGRSKGAGSQRDPLLLPLSHAGRGYGVLVLWAPRRVLGRCGGFSENDEVLARWIIELYGKHYFGGVQDDYRAMLMYGLLERRQFLVGALDLEAVVGEQLERFLKTSGSGCCRGGVRPGERCV